MFSWMKKWWSTPEEKKSPPAYIRVIVEGRQASGKSEIARDIQKALFRAGHRVIFADDYTHPALEQILESFKESENTIVIEEHTIW